MQLIASRKKIARCYMSKYASPK